MGSIDANQCRSGTKLMVDGELYTVTERSHHKPGKGGAFVRFKLKGIVSGKSIDHTVRAGTKMESADITVQAMQYLYRQGDDFVLMDNETYEQVTIGSDLIGSAAGFLTENAEVEVTLHEGRPIGVELPQKMVFTVVETIDNPNMGNTATNVTKEATIDTGLTIQVPPFIKTGEKIRVLTENSTYLERA
ncbi:MAG: elongation factor P [Acidobacteriota bacterium]|nr:elongation factor P [Acidobacteriota bacterium]